MNSRATLTVLCEAPVLDGILESYFIREVLLGALERPVRFVPVMDIESAALADNVLVINLFDRMVPLIRRFITAGCRNLGVYHMGDEKGRCDRTYYGEVDYVLRNYYFEAAFQLPEGGRCIEAIWVPNGYRIGIGARRPETLLPASARTNMLFFAGFVGTTEKIPARVEMLDVINKAQLPATVITTPGFAKGLGPARYSVMLENSRFALVPEGQAPETIRLFDALELGCIPISLELAFLNTPKAMGGAPIVQLKSWSDLPGWLAKTMASPTFESDIGDHQKKCIEWWSEFKRLQGKRVAHLIERAFART